MKFLKFLQVKSRKTDNKIADFYQQSVDKAGRAEIEKIIKLGMKMPVFML
ncbi:MAG TPA: hypothetical protein VG917_01200 [Patescibacteria group bacterium]|nr:hypothetical protein [Patescibacteria group bacterium]